MTHDWACTHFFDLFLVKSIKIFQIHFNGTLDKDNIIKSTCLDGHAKSWESFYNLQGWHIHDLVWLHALENGKMKSTRRGVKWGYSSTNIGGRDKLNLFSGKVQRIGFESVFGASQNCDWIVLIIVSHQKNLDVSLFISLDRRVNEIRCNLLLVLEDDNFVVVSHTWNGVSIKIIHAHCWCSGSIALKSILEVDLKVRMTSSVDESSSLLWMYKQVAREVLKVEYLWTLLEILCSV